MEKKINRTTSTQVIITGRVGSVKKIENSNSNQTFVSLAVNRKTIINNEKVDETDWHDFVFYDKLADVVNKYVKKGDKIVINGELETWGNNDDEKQKTVIKANSFNFDTSSSVLIIGFLETIYPRKTTEDPLIISVYTLRKVKINNEKKLKKDYHNVMVTGELAKTVEDNLPKNIKLLIKGEIQTIIKDNVKESIIRARKFNIL